MSSRGFWGQLGRAFRAFFAEFSGEAPALSPGTTEVVTAKADDSALVLLSLFQREGRLIDFLEQDIATFSDEDVGVAARVVHAGCKKALTQVMTIAPVRSEEEGERLTVTNVNAEIKLTGNVQGSAPFTGTLRHRGWRASEVELPSRIGAEGHNILAQAELEL